MPLLGRYRAEDTDSMHSQYSITMDVKETDKSYIFCLVEFQSRYAHHKWSAYLRNPNGSSSEKTAADMQSEYGTTTISLFTRSKRGSRSIL